MMTTIRRIAAVLAGGVALSGCTSDPAFWDAVAQGLDQAAYEMSNQPVCSTYVDRFGRVQQHCVPAWQSQPQPVYVIDSSYGHHPDRYRDRDRDHRRDDRRDRRDRRDHNHHRDGRDPKRDR